VDDSTYDVSLEMLAKLKALPKRIRMSIADMLDKSWDKFLDLEGYSQMIGGVVKGDKPFFFEIEYVKDPFTPIIILDIEEISLDDYLDYIDEEKTLNSNESKIDKGIERIEGSNTG